MTFPSPATALGRAPADGGRNSPPDPAERALEAETTANRLLYEWPVGGSVGRAEVSEYKGTTFLSIREWYQKKGTWQPGRKGISVPLHRVADLAAALATVDPETGT